jgi:zinc protease
MRPGILWCSRARLAALAMLAAAPAETSAQTQARTPLRAVTLPNGLQVIVLQNPSVPLVTLNMVLRAGAFTQRTEADEGLPHFIEHALFRRGDNDGVSFDEMANKIDASWNGSTSTESVQYYMTLPSKNLSAGVELLAEMVRRPNFSKKVLDAERPIVRGELERRASEPLRLLYLESDMLLWQGAGWKEKNPGGNVLTLNMATPERLNELYKRYYVPNNAALIITGDVTDSLAIKVAEKAFGGWKKGPDPHAGAPPTAIAPLNAVASKVTTGDVKDVTILVRWHGPRTDTDEAATYAADVFAGLINQPLSGTQKRLVDAGLVEAVSFSYSTLRNVGPMELVARTTADRAVAATEALAAEIKRFTEPQYYTDDDLVLAKKFQRVAARFREESAVTSAHVIASFWSSASIDYYLGYDDKLESQTRADIQRFVSTFINGRPMVVSVLMGPDAWTPIARGMQSALRTFRVPVLP